MDKICIELVDVEVSFLDRVVLNIPRLAVHQFDRIGIVGKNGAGKSTLLKLINGQLKPEKGRVNRFAELAYFDQLSAPEEGEVDYELAAKLAVPGTETDSFSGGEVTRLKLAQLLSTYHEGLLIDEPTTHLDAEGTQFFIDELTYYYGALILVSHDRYVLDQLVTKIWEVENSRVTEYVGNYSDYAAHKELLRWQQLEQHESYLQEKSRLLKAAADKMKKAEKISQANNHMSKKEANAKPNKAFMTKSKGTSQKAVQRAAKAIEHRLVQMEEVEAPEQEHVVHFHQAKALELHNKFPIIADSLNLLAGNKILLREANFQFPLGQTIAITGKNGSGKTTLLRHILGRGERVTLSPKAVIGTYEQTGYQFQEDASVLDYMRIYSEEKESKIRAVLHAMNFTGNDLLKNVGDLSGGEAIRLVLCRLFLGPYNILFLDEPTNFLDVFCIEALESFLKAYAGTVVLVSHDHMFVERVADCVYAIEDLQVKPVT